MPPPKNLKHKLLMPSRKRTETGGGAGGRTDGAGGRTDRGNTICPFHHSSSGGGIIKIMVFCSQ